MIAVSKADAGVLTTSTATGLAVHLVDVNIFELVTTVVYCVVAAVWIWDRLRRRNGRG